MSGFVRSICARLSVFRPLSPPYDLRAKYLYFIFEVSILFGYRKSLEVELLELWTCFAYRIRCCRLTGTGGLSNGRLW